MCVRTHRFDGVSNRHSDQCALPCRAEILFRLRLLARLPSRVFWPLLFRLFFFAIAVLLALRHVSFSGNATKGQWKRNNGPINRNRIIPRIRFGSTERAEARSRLPPVHPRGQLGERGPYRIRLRPAADPQKSFRYECRQRTRKLFSGPRRGREDPHAQRR
jgi:hypothetical protein